MYASLLILLKFGPGVYSISNRYVCAGCVYLCVSVGRVEGRRRGWYRLAAASFTRNLIPIPFLSFSLSLSLSPPPLLLADLLFKSGGEWRLSGARVNQSNDIFPALSFRCAAYCGGEEGNFVIFMRLGRSTRWVSRGRFETKEFRKGIENSRWDLNNEDGTRGRWKF